MLKDQGLTIKVRLNTGKTDQGGAANHSEGKKKQKTKTGSVKWDTRERTKKTNTVQEVQLAQV